MYFPLSLFVAKAALNNFPSIACHAKKMHDTIKYLLKFYASRRKKRTTGAIRFELAAKIASEEKGKIEQGGADQYVSIASFISRSIHNYY